MALRATQIQTCDRCQRPFKETFLKQGDNVPLIKRAGCKFITTASDSKNPGEVKEKVVFEYEDLCDSCRGAIDSLMEKASLSTSKPKASRKTTSASGEEAKGRAAKKAAVKKAADEPEKPEKPKRGRGRPSKTEQEGGATKRGPGRPPKKVQEVEEEDYTEDEVEERDEEEVEDLEEAEDTVGEEEESDEAVDVEDTDDDGAKSEDDEDSGEDDEEDLIDEILSEGSGNLVEDPETGDIYNTETGEIVQTREEREKASSKPASKTKSKKSDAHPF
jgi:hypothetical protein